MKKILSLLCFLFLLGLLENCCNLETIHLQIIRVDWEVEQTVVEPDAVLGFRILPIDSMLAMNTSFSLGLTPSAHAIGCDDFDYQRLAELTDMQLYSDQDFSDELPAGTPLDKIVEVHRINGRGGQEKVINLTQLIEEITDEDFRLDRSAAIANAQFKIRQRPSQERVHQFRIELRTADGGIFQSTSPSIEWR
ncbi:MAG: hypothetical protein AAFV95_00335 [Bacteroidota bacterium]